LAERFTPMEEDQIKSALTNPVENPQPWIDTGYVDTGIYNVFDLKL